MDIGTLIGTIGTFLLLAGAILVGHDGHRGDITKFMDPVGAGIVLGGSVLTMFTCLPIRSVMAFPKVFRKTVYPDRHDHKALVTTLVELAVIARRDGLLALDQRATKELDPFLASGIRLIVDGTDPETVERMMRIEINAVMQRHAEGKVGFDAFGKYGPAYGMIGTLVGLVLMLGNLSDPDAIGPGMAVALLGTMYGCLISSCLFLPLGDKLTLLSHREKHTRELILEGILSIQAGDFPRILEQKLNAYLAPHERTSSDTAKS